VMFGYEADSVQSRRRLSGDRIRQESSPEAKRILLWVEIDYKVV
jgi:hypothetical protein